MMKENSSRWKPGVSGNPAGRRPGTGSVQRLRLEIEAVVPQIIEKMTQKALQGDVAAARLLLERSIPPLRPSEAPQTLQIDGDDLTGQAKSIVALAASGDVSVQHAAQFVAALGTLAKLIEVDALERRIRSLEKSVETRHTQKAFGA